jgi:hypothetical protein
LVSAALTPPPATIKGVLLEKKPVSPPLPLNSYSENYLFWI